MTCVSRAWACAYRPSRVKAEGDEAHVTTEFRDLEYPNDDDSGIVIIFTVPALAHHESPVAGVQRPQNARDRARFIEVSIDAKQLVKFFALHGLATSAVACMSLPIACYGCERA